MVNFRQLRYFVAIVDAGSVTKAAQVLHIAQPSLSLHMTTLESELGTQLLNRSVRGVSPTQAGWAVYRHAQFILKLTAQTTDIALGSSVEVSGRVRVGMPPSIAMIVAAPLLSTLYREFPGILVELYENSSTHLTAELFDERVDLSVMIDRLPSASIALRPLFDERLFLVYRGPSTGAKPTLENVALMPLVLSPRSTRLRHTLDAAFASASLTPRVVAETSIATLLNVVTQCEMATLVPSSALSRTTLSSDLCIEPLEPAIWRRAVLAWSRQLELTEATRCVRDAIVRTVHHLVASGEWCDVQIAAEESSI